MRFLLDTHTFLWFINADKQLSPTARQLIEESNNQPLLSLVSVWEMAIKVSIGKLNLTQPIEILIPYHMKLSGIELLPIEVFHVALVATLPYYHRDPFDRLLIAQSQVEKIPIVGLDLIFDDYGVSRLW